jgi:hypothetical protein
VNYDYQVPVSVEIVPAVPSVEMRSEYPGARPTVLATFGRITVSTTVRRNTRTGVA